MDYGTLAAIYLIGGLVFGVWFTYQWFEGGENSKYYERLRKQYPGADALSPWLLFAGAALGVIAHAIVWPYALVRYLVALHRSRRHAATLYLHPRLAKLRAKLTGREEQYEEVLSEFGLDVAVTALHAIDLPAAVEYGLDAIAQRGAMPARPAAADYEDATYGNVIKVAVGYTELRALDAAKKRDKLCRAMDIGNDLAARFDHIRNPGMCIGSLIVFLVHGWAPLSALTLTKEKYSLHLKPEFNNADHMAAVFGGIRVMDDRDVTRVVPKGSDLSREEYEQMVEEHLAEKARPPAPPAG